MARIFIHRDRAGRRLAGEPAERFGIPAGEQLIDALVADRPGARPLLRILAVQERIERELDRRDHATR